MTKIKSFDLPYIGIDTEKYGVIYSETGDYSVVIQCKNPIEQYGADYEAFRQFHQLFTNIVKVLGPDYTIQKQDIFIKKSFEVPSTDDFLSKVYFNHFYGRHTLAIQSYLIITKNIRRNIFFHYDEQSNENFNENVEKVRSLLQYGGAEPQILTEKEIKQYVKRIVAFNFRNNHFYMDNIKSSRHSISIGDTKIKSISLVDVDEVDLPNAVKPYVEMNEFGYPYPMDLMSFLHSVPDFETMVYNQVIVVPPQKTELVKLEAKRRRHEAIPDPANKVAVSDIDELLNDVAKNNRMLVYGHFTIMIQAKEAHFNQTTNHIESALFNLGITPSKNSYNQMELFRCSLPGNSGELQPYDKFLTTADAAICFMFKERPVVSEQSGFRLFLSDRRGIPVSIDTQDKPMNTNRINNRNMFVLGPSGIGKSFFMNHLVPVWRKRLACASHPHLVQVRT